MYLHVIIQPPRSGGYTLLPEARDVPDPDSLVKGGRHHHVLARVELGAHHVVVVPSQHLEDGGSGVQECTCYLAHTEIQFLLCQFHILTVWSSLADNIQGYSWWKTVVRM